ncbi:MAG: DUF7010 family protein [Caulobacterales bacterium]|uniref:DUF7010 family protein n=1 Tax=Glycocaulis sp. TaxID=1969725 RepID=UPI003FA03A44
MELKTELTELRRESYGNLRGGYPIVLAGAIYWIVLAGLSRFLEPVPLLQTAFGLSGLIFPLAVALAWVTGNRFLKERNALSPLLVPAFIAMLLFWPMLFIAAAESSAGVVMAILAIGMSLHWPVIGWTYGRTALFSSHAIIRAVLVAWIFNAYPDERLTLIPLAVAACYLVTALIVFIDAGRVARRNRSATAGMAFAG